MGGCTCRRAAAGVGYFAGEKRQDRTMTDTAVLAAEAMADATILDEGLKYAIDREGPMLDNAQGQLWPQGISGWPNSPSMPSEHAMNVWSFAHVVAGQYNGIATQALVYGLATTVSVSRVTGAAAFSLGCDCGEHAGMAGGGICAASPVAGGGDAAGCVGGGDAFGAGAGGAVEFAARGSRGVAQKTDKAGADPCSKRIADRVGEGGAGLYTGRRSSPLKSIVREVPLWRCTVSSVPFYRYHREL